MAEKKDAKVRQAYPGEEVDLSQPVTGYGDDTYWEGVGMTQAEIKQKLAERKTKPPRPKGARVRRNTEGDFTYELPDGTVLAGPEPTRIDLDKAAPWI